MIGEHCWFQPFFNIAKNMASILVVKYQIPSIYLGCKLSRFLGTTAMLASGSGLFECSGNDSFPFSRSLTACQCLSCHIGNVIYLEGKASIVRRIPGYSLVRRLDRLRLRDQV